jgi:hypothetical protein
MAIQLHLEIEDSPLLAHASLHHACELATKFCRCLMLPNVGGISSKRLPPQKPNAEFCSFAKTPRYLLFHLHLDPSQKEKLERVYVFYQDWSC